VQIVDEAITNNATLEVIEDLLYTFCDFIPTLEQNCKDLVDENLQMIVDLLVNEYLDPNQVCESIFLCP
jgi:hypothetical protein